MCFPDEGPGQEMMQATNAKIEDELTTSMTLAVKQNEGDLIEN